MSADAENTSPSSSALVEQIPDEVIEGAQSNVIIEGGDWICSDNDCKNVNFGRRTQCNKCHRERSVEKSNSSGGSLAKKKLGTEIGKAAAEKSRGLFSAEDWQCSKCANVNWARRQTCNMCNAPKFCDVEERTGYGGGYNDRGVVEYKDRSESDSDYDEFGRLKKRTIKKSDGRNSSDIHVDERELAREYADDDEDEDDDEEDDGDGDLSKYDLWGDDEVVNASKNTLKEKISNTLTRSPNSQPKQSSSSSNSSESKSSSHSRSRTTSSSSSSSATSKSNGQVKKRRKEKDSSSRSRSRNRSREVSKTHSAASSKKSNRKLSKSRSRSRSSSKSDRRRMAHQANSHSSPSSRGKNSKTRLPKSKSRSRSPRSRSHSRTRHVSKTLKCKRSNSSRSPESELPAASSRYRRRSRSKSLSAGKRRR